MRSTVAPERVLIIDDDPMVGRTTLAHVVASGHEGRVTGDAGEFMSICREWKPTFVIVDLVMEGADGLEVLKRLAAAGCTSTVIIASGQDGRVLDAARRLAEERGLSFGGILAKPYRRGQLAELLSRPPASREADSSPPLGTERPWAAGEFAEAFRDGLTSGAITVVFQPKVSCGDGRVVGFEALARWAHPERGDVPPATFVPMAESAGLVGLLTDRVMTQALEWFASDRYREGKSLAINLSAAGFPYPELDTRLLRACRLAGVPTEQVIIEVTETSAMQDPVLSLQFLTRLRLQGFDLSLDDFGTGYSSMAQLARLPFSEIKVDRSFVTNAATSKESAIVIRSIVDLGHALGMECTAEGVESQEVLSLLKEMGCDRAQGYYIARPMVPDDLDVWLQSAPA